MATLSIKIFGILLLTTILLVSGILIFIKGFLLSRTVVEDISACKPEFALRAKDHLHHGTEGCWMHGRFERAIVIIIDALRYDFLTYNSSKTVEETSYYHNKLTSIHRLHKEKPKNSRIYKFMADPPTTTMQRLKGLTTGSLPTFVDAGSNFQSYEIMEDNIVNQLITSERRIKFFGDDTWLSLFPNKFYKSFGFPSFDVKDLHTVDNGILKHLYPEMKRHDWDVIIAHFLGVDHCGHRYGPNHSAMADKLSQMNSVIRNVTELMKEDTVLFVMGDHGMTRTGDHGGDSFNELAAGLWIYSPGRLASSNQDMVEEIPQTDFVPTLSLLLGLPIPFSNLGKIIPELFSHCSWWGTDTNELKRRYHKIKALRLNAHQVNGYLNTYQDISSDLPRNELQELKNRFVHAESQLQELVTKWFTESNGGSGNVVDDLAVLENEYFSYLKDARNLCEGVWAKFDLKMISLGLVTIVAGVFLLLYFFLMPNEDVGEFPKSVGFIVGGAILHLVYLAVHLSVFPKTVPPVMAFVIAIVLIFVIFIIVKAKLTEYIVNSLSLDNIIAFVITAMNLSIYFSNSFVVHEDVISMFLLQTLLMSIWCTIAIESKLKEKSNETLETGKSAKKTKSHQDLLQWMTSPFSITLVLTLTCMALIQLSSNFKTCREEQHSCTDSFFLLPLSSIDKTPRNQRYLFSIACLSALFYAVRRWMKYYGNLNGMSFGVVFFSYTPWAGVVFIALHWALQALPQSLLDTIPQWQQVIMAQIVYAVVIISLLALMASPMLIYSQTRQNSPLNLSCLGNKAQAIPTIYNQLKVQLSESEDDKPPLVYGLGSVYSSSVLALVCLVSLFLCLLLNDGASPSILLALLSFYLALELYSALMTSLTKQVKGKHHLDRFSWSGIVLLCLFSTVFFYTSGHQATIPSIRMEAAYTGFYGNFQSVILPGFLIWSNTFASHIFFGLASPLLVFWPILSSALLPWLVKNKAQRQEQSSWQGDFRLFNDGIRLRKRFLHLFCGILLLSSLKVLSTACAATFHRRHLMVWKIFAPRFIYEAAMFATTCVTLLLSYLFVLRVDSALSKFVRTLPTETGKEN